MHHAARNSCLGLWRPCINSLGNINDDCPEQRGAPRSIDANMSGRPDVDVHPLNAELPAPEGSPLDIEATNLEGVQAALKALQGAQFIADVLPLLGVRCRFLGAL